MLERLTDILTSRQWQVDGMAGMWGTRLIELQMLIASRACDWHAVALVSKNEICAGSSNRLDLGFSGLLRLGWIASVEVFRQILKIAGFPSISIVCTNLDLGLAPSVTLYRSCLPLPNNRESRMSSTSYSSSSSTTIGCGETGKPGPPGYRPPLSFPVS
jgi:hypothetical protein